ncbi:MAG: YbjN domain-containing protein [Blastomonas sp.]
MNEQNIDLDRDEAAPVDMLSALFEARGWPCELVGEDELLTEVKGSWTSYQLRAIWRAEDNVLQMLAMPDIRVGDEKRQAMCEALALINEQLWLGHFDIWSDSGVVVYRNGLLLGSDSLLGLDQAQLAVEAAIDECDRFYPVFQFILWGDKSPAEALAAALIDTQGEA